MILRKTEPRLKESAVFSKSTCHVYDQRYQKLLSKNDWQSLPLPIRRRFSKRLAAYKTRYYVGKVHSTELTRIGWFFAQAAKLFGGALPTSRELKGPAYVAVTETPEYNGQCWQRTYHRPGKLPQVITSIKKFSGPTGLEEYIGAGLSMYLIASVEHGALVFRSNDYRLNLWGHKIKLPWLLTPGQLEVVHKEELEGWFSFTLKITHPVFGFVLQQVAFFQEAENVSAAN